MVGHRRADVSIAHDRAPFSGLQKKSAFKNGRLRPVFVNTARHGIILRSVRK